MVAASPIDPGPGAPRSTLVHGGPENALSALGASLAHESGRPLAWAEFAGASSRLEPALRSALERLVRPDGLAVAGPSDLSTVRSPPPAAKLVQLESLSPELRERLEGFLRAPLLFQRLSAELADEEGRLMILVTNVDALPSNVLWGTLEDAGLHEELHREGLGVVATFRGSAPAPLRAPFDRVLEVRLPEGRPWRGATVREEKPAVGRGHGSGRPLAEYLARTDGLGPR